MSVGVLVAVGGLGVSVGRGVLGMVGVDVGGTFTDIFILAEATGIASVNKAVAEMDHLTQTNNLIDSSKWP